MALTKVAKMSPKCKILEAYAKWFLETVCRIYTWQTNPSYKSFLSDKFWHSTLPDVWVFSSAIKKVLKYKIECLFSWNPFMFMEQRFQRFLLFSIVLACLLSMLFLTYNRSYIVQILHVRTLIPSWIT